jgi:hypothetical protein
MRSIVLALLLAIATPAIVTTFSDAAIAVTQAQKQRLRKGMTEAQVKQVLGQPHAWTLAERGSGRRGRSLILIYPEGGRAFLVTLTDGSVTGWKTGDMPQAG